MKLYTEIIALCDYASISREGKLSIMGVFDEVRVQNFPGGIARAFLVATVNGKPDTSYSLRLDIEHGSKTKGTFNMELKTSPNGKSNIVTELINVPFEQEGEYSFVIYHRKEKVGSTLLKVFGVKQNEEVKYKLPN